MKVYPVEFVWRRLNVVEDDGNILYVDAMVPLPRYGNVAARQFVRDKPYVMIEQAARSLASHNQYFAAIKDAFDNLPETMAPRFPTAEHLRKWVLIEVGLFEEKEFVTANPDQARALGKYLQAEDDFIRIYTPGNKVIVRRAKSQSYATMPHKNEFQESKTKVLDYLDNLCEVERGTFWREGGRNA